MVGGLAALLGVALAAAGATPAPAPGKAPAKAAAQAPCTRYRAQAEKNDRVPEDQAAAWATAALERAGLLDPASACFVHVRITAGPIRTGGRQDGWVAHVAVSTRRYLRDGKLVTHEKGLLLVEAEQGALVARARSFVEEWVAALR